ncbi:hypothetical protein PIB30_024293 [Stylosanthes scabra]|uniref:Uncharacterized protein n=1 Tax=Stylosanthes scabra TaxID=79078 RepID=A0ABU6XBE2_9FABA|nr:hypothetical protein [Stylosanthes scabra]
MTKRHNNRLTASFPWHRVEEAAGLAMATSYLDGERTKSGSFSSGEPWRGDSNKVVHNSEASSLVPVHPPPPCHHKLVPAPLLPPEPLPSDYTTTIIISDNPLFEAVKENRHRCSHVLPINVGRDNCL